MDQKYNNKNGKMVNISFKPVEKTRKFRNIIKIGY